MSVGTIRRKRAFLPKVKTGCKTCKVRKVKCDEAKPCCRRCSSTGRKCEGYTRDDSPPNASALTTTALGRAGTPVFHQQVSTGVESWLKSDRERRSFHFFLTHAGLRLGGYFQTPFWTREVIQAAISYPSIRHLVVALGSTYEHFEGRAQDDQSQTEFALQQANRSIYHLTKKPGSGQSSLESSSVVVTASLFTILSSMQGHIAEAMEHVQSGIRVLQNLEDEISSSEDSSYSSSASNRSGSPALFFPVPITRLRSLLNTLYLQRRMMRNEEAVNDFHRDPLTPEIEFPTSFASLTDAQEHIESLLGNQLSLFETTLMRYPITDEDDIAFVEAQTDTLRYALECSRNALDAYVDRRALGSNASDEVAIKVLRLYHIHLGIRLTIGALQDDTRELAFDDFEPQFEQMLDLCKQILSPGEEEERPTYSSGLGVVPPLHMIAARCRNPLIRVEAVDLLQKAGRREGLWDSSIIGKIAATTSSLELDEELIGHSRVREVKTNFIGDRRAEVVFVTGTENNQTWHRRTVAW